MTKKQLDKLAKKYNVLDWTYVSHPVFETHDGKVWMVQTISDIESLFKLGEGKIVCIYDLEVKNPYPGKVRGTIIGKEYLEAIKAPLSN
jgi:hypothetical protein